MNDNLEYIFTIDSQAVIVREDDLSISELSNGNFRVKLYVANITQKITKTRMNNILNLTTTNSVKRLNKVKQADSYRKIFSFDEGKARFANVFEIIINKTTGAVEDFKMYKSDIMVTKNYNYESVQNEHSEERIRESILLLEKLYNVASSNRINAKEHLKIEHLIRSELGLVKNVKIPQIIELIINTISEKLGEYFFINGYPFLYYNQVNNSESIMNEFIKNFNSGENNVITRDTLLCYRELLSYINDFSIENKGFYSIGSDYNCRYTSSITRKADLITNILLEEFVYNKASLETKIYWVDQLRTFEKRKIR